MTNLRNQPKSSFDARKVLFSSLTVFTVIFSGITSFTIPALATGPQNAEQILIEQQNKLLLEEFRNKKPHLEKELENYASRLANIRENIEKKIKELENQQEYNNNPKIQEELRHLRQVNNGIFKVGTVLARMLESLNDTNLNQQKIMWFSQTLVFAQRYLQTLEQIYKNLTFPTQSI